MDRVPAALDAVVIGSGVGGLTAAAVLAKAGKRVLVVEQHDQAGGCTHTFENKGFEFDVGKLRRHTHSFPQPNLPLKQVLEMEKIAKNVAINQKPALLVPPTHPVNDEAGTFSSVST